MRHVSKAGPACSSHGRSARHHQQGCNCSQFILSLPKSANYRGSKICLATSFRVQVVTNPIHQQHDQANQNANQTPATIFLYTKMGSTSYYQPQYQFSNARQQVANPTNSGNKEAAG
ncbi:hypothetical protein Nepgr_030056 [Nepenthes gracilis]|uniref:Uncharacterized protein n=1 Tax=Nepenthes gracilis TaxID=150966 RepID=A0AAD3Y3U0_NEPGR|nr:hypothetical protein Nepgr_030056 [Nepenthes gracilis]